MQIQRFSKEHSSGTCTSEKPACETRGAEKLLTKEKRSRSFRRNRASSTRAASSFQQLPEAAASVLMPTEWSKQKHHALTQPQFDKLWEKTIQFLPVATKKGYRKSKPADLSMGYARKILRNELEAKKAAASSGKKPRAKKKRAKKKRENTQAGVSNAALRKKRIRVSNAV